ncbi:MAG: NAD(P)H-dependent oxidoreductase [Bacillota bacterium]
MRPNDASGHLPPEQRPFRVLIVSGSNRRQYNCPGVDSKSRMLMLRMAKRLPSDWEIDYEDLGNVHGRMRIQPCNACVSTSMALCCWPCNCYEKGNRKEPDLMWELDMYARFDLADAWAIVGPVNWYGPSTNLKTLFDRLVCANGGNPKEALIEHKNPELAMALEHKPEWKEIALNHLEGRTCAFFTYGDHAWDERDADGRPVYLSHPDYFDPQQEPEGKRETYEPFVWQCRFSGIEVPDDLWHYQRFGMGRKYSDNQAEDMAADGDFMRGFDAWTDRFAAFVRAKGKVTPGKFRAFGYRPPGHFWADIKLMWRDRRMRLGRPPPGSSPEVQQSEGLNDDAVLDPKSGEGRRLRRRN